MSNVLYINNDNLVSVDKLRNLGTEVYVNDATVTVRLYTKATGVNVTGETWPLAMSYVAASDGKYIGTLIDTLPLVENTVYTAEIIASVGADKMGQWNIDFTAKVRDK